MDMKPFGICGGNKKKKWHLSKTENGICAPHCANGWKPKNTPESKESHAVISIPFSQPIKNIYQYVSELRILYEWRCTVMK